MILATVLSAAVLALVCFTDMMPIFPYELKITDTEPQIQEYARYHDLTGNGNVEKITFCRYGEIISIEVFDSDQSFLGAARLDGDWPTTGDYHVFGDAENDGTCEIYCLTEQGDSLFLNVIRDIEQNDPEVIQLFIGRTSAEKGRRDLRYRGAMVDLNGDGMHELLFLVHGGFSLTPRQLFIYSPSENRVAAAEDIGASYTTTSIFDIDGDGNKEIFMGSGSTQNFGPDDPVSFGDHKAGAFIYDREMNMIGEPFILTKGKPNIYYFPILIDEACRRGVVVYNQSGPEPNRLLVLDQENTILRDHAFEGNNFIVTPVQTPDEKLRYYICSMQYPVLEYDVNKDRILETGVGGVLMVREEQTIEKISWPFFLLFEDQITVVDHGLKRISNSLQVGRVSRRYDDGPAQPDGHFEYILYDRADTTAIFIHLHENPLYSIRWVIFLVLTLLSFLLFFAISWLVRYFFLRRRHLEYQLQARQLQSVHNQLQPHFTFNVLNTVGAMIYSEEKEKAYSYLNDVSDLIRAVLDNTRQHLWTLDQELQFIDTYVRLENVRFNQRFHFEKRIDPVIHRGTLIPKMMIQTFVENALKHGLSHKKKNCHLILDIRTENGHIRVMIEDNGIGRKRAGEIIRHRSGNGIQFIEQFIHSYNRMAAVPITLEISDLVDEMGEPSGTRVVLMIPREIWRFDD